MTPDLREQILALYRSGDVRAAIELTRQQYPGMSRAEARKVIKHADCCCANELQFSADVNAIYVMDGC